MVSRRETTITSNAWGAAEEGREEKEREDEFAVDAFKKDEVDDVDEFGEEMRIDEFAEVAGEYLRTFLMQRDIDEKKDAIRNGKSPFSD